MGYHYNAAQLNNLRKSIYGAIGTSGYALDVTAKAAQLVCNAQAMQGEGADKIKDYLSTVHCNVICAGMCEIIALINTSIAEYITEYHDVDSEVDAVIDTDELQEIKRQLLSYKTQFQTADESLKNIAKKVGDISSYSYSGDKNALNWLTLSGSVLQKITDHIDSIEGSPIGSIDQAINALDGIKSMLRAGHQLSPHNFSRTAFLSSSEYASFYASMQAADEKLQEFQATKAAHCEETLNAIDAEWDRRAKKAEIMKFGLAILETIAIATVAIVFTPALGILGVAAVGGGIGMITGGVKEGWDQWGRGEYAANEGFDYGDMAIEAGIGGAKGAVAGWIGATFAGVPQSSLGEKLIANTLKEVSTNTLNMGVDVVDSLIKGEHEIFQQIGSGEYGAELVGKSILSGTVGTAVGELIDLPGDIVKEMPKGKFGQIAVNTIVGAEKKVITKSVEDITDYVVETAVATDENGMPTIASKEDWEEGWQQTKDKMLDPKTILARATSGGVESGLTEAAKVTDTPDKYLKPGSEHGKSYSYYRRNESGKIEEVRVTSRSGVEKETVVDVVDGRTHEGRAYSDYEENLEHQQAQNSTSKSIIKSGSTQIKWNSSSGESEKDQKPSGSIDAIPTPLEGDKKIGTSSTEGGIYDNVARVKKVGSILAANRQAIEDQQNWYNEYKKRREKEFITTAFRAREIIKEGLKPDSPPVIIANTFTSMPIPLETR